MLVLSRKLGEKVVIDGDIVVSVVEVKGNRVRLAFEAPDHVTILRSELVADRSAELDPDLADKPLEWTSTFSGPCL